MTETASIVDIPVVTSADLTLTRREDIYRPFMSNTLAEMYRVLRPNSAAVIVVGDVKVGTGAKTEILNSALLIWEEAQRVGFGIDRLINDTYALHNRSMLVFNSLKWDYGTDDHTAKSSVLVDRCLSSYKRKHSVAKSSYYVAGKPTRA